MGRCSAMHCSNNHRNKGMRRFPSCPERRRLWEINCRKDNWTATENSRLCDDHFEPSQFENNRADGAKRLRPDAIPTIFNVPNPLSSSRNRSHVSSPRKSDVIHEVHIPTPFVTSVAHDHEYKTSSNDDECIADMLPISLVCTEYAGDHDPDPPALQEYVNDPTVHYGGHMQLRLHNQGLRRRVFQLKKRMA